MMSSPDHDRISAPPLAMEVPQQRGSLKSSIHNEVTALVRRVPSQWLGMTGYLVTGVFLGLVLIAALTLPKNNDPLPTSGVITDNVQRLHAREISEWCWRGVSKDAARLTVNMEVGVDGKVRSAVASGETEPMRSCVESHVRAWEFLPQAQPQAMVLPFEIDRR